MSLRHSPPTHFIAPLMSIFPHERLGDTRTMWLDSRNLLGTIVHYWVQAASPEDGERICGCDDNKSRFLIVKHSGPLCLRCRRSGRLANYGEVEPTGIIHTHCAMANRPKTIEGEKCNVNPPSCTLFRFSKKEVMRSMTTSTPLLASKRARANGDIHYACPDWWSLRQQWFNSIAGQDDEWLISVKSVSHQSLVWRGQGIKVPFG